MVLKDHVVFPYMDKIYSMVYGLEKEVVFTCTL